MTIEKLTDTEVQIVATTSAGAKLLRLSNALTAENKRLIASIQCLHGLRNAAEASLAAATALVVDVPSLEPDRTEWCRRRDALLANQPAAPNTPLADLDGHTPREMCLAGQPAAPDEIGDYPRNFADRVSKMMAFTPAEPTYDEYDTGGRKMLVYPAAPPDVHRGRVGLFDDELMAMSKAQLIRNYQILRNYCNADGKEPAAPTRTEKESK